MSATPKLSVINGKYILKPVDDDKWEKIPGLKPHSFGVEGHIDSVSVLLKRLGMDPIPQRETLAVDAHSKAREYQNEGIAWLVSHLSRERGALLADDMGLGKTMQTVLTWVCLDKPDLLIVCPASVRRGWVRELATWGDVPDVLLVESAKDWGKYEPGMPVVTSYQLIQKAPDNAFFDMLVMDEMQNLRGRGAKMSRHLLDVSKQCSYRLGLTGTPMWSRPNDLWMVLRILFPDYRFGSADEFDLAYCNAYWNKWGGKVNKGVSNATELQMRLKYVMLRRTKQDVKTELPPVTRTVRYVDPVPRARELLRMAMVGSRTMYDALAETLLHKLDATVEAVIESGTNCFVATWRKEDAHRLKEMIEKATKQEVLLITGDISHKNRDLIIATAQKTKQHIVATIDSVGVGVDGIQKATSTLIIHALDYVPIKTSQLIARVDRIGQKDPVTVTFIVMKDSADDLVMNTIVEKLDQWLRVMGKDDNTAIRDTLVNEKELAKMEKSALKAMYESFGKVG